MQKSIDKISLLCMLLYATAGNLRAQVPLERYDTERKDSVEIKKNQLFATVQYAGSTGFLSFGAGITNKKGNLRNELLYGFVPATFGGPLNKLTYKLSYYPFRIRLKNGNTFMPVNPTFYLAYDIGPNFSMVPSYQKYDKAYYWWSSGLRRHYGFSIAYNKQIGMKYMKEALFYLEVNTNDLYLMTLWDNVGEIPFTSIWSFGIGTKIAFR